MDEAVHTQLDEVGPLLPVAPRPLLRAEASPSVAVGRQGLRRVRRSAGGGSSSAGGGSSGLGMGGTDDDVQKEDDDSEGDDGVSTGRDGGMGDLSIASIPARTPPALLIPQQADSGHGEDSPLLPPPEKVPKLDDVGQGGTGSGRDFSSSQSAAASLTERAPPVHETYHAQEGASSYGHGTVSTPIDQPVVAGGAVGGLRVGDAAAAGGGSGVAESPLSFSGSSFEHGVAAAGHDFSEKGGTSHTSGFPSGTADVEAGFLQAPPSGGAGGSMAAGTPSTGSSSAPLESLGLRGSAPSQSISPEIDQASSGGGEGLVETESVLERLERRASSPGVIAGSLLGTGTDVVASALEGIGDDIMAGEDPSMSTSGAFSAPLMTSAGAVTTSSNVPAGAEVVGAGMEAGAVATSTISVPGVGAVDTHTTPPSLGGSEV